MKKNILLTILAFALGGCMEPYLVEVNNGTATSQLFLIGEMSSTGYRYLGSDANGTTMNFKNRKNQEKVSFIVKETSKDTSSISILSNNGVEETKLESLMNRVKSYSEDWKDKPKDADNVTYIDNPGSRINPIEATSSDMEQLQKIDMNNDLSYIDDRR